MTKSQFKGRVLGLLPGNTPVFVLGTQYTTATTEILESLLSRIAFQSMFQNAF